MINQNKIVNHLLTLSRAVREKTATLEEVQEIIKRDVNYYVILYNQKSISEVEYNGILQLYYDFEEAFDIGIKYIK